MNVHLAGQTLSKSVSDGLLFCENLNLLTGIRGTATFSSIFNDAFDLLNCRNKLSKRNYNYSLNNITLNRTEQFLSNLKIYIENVKFETNEKYSRSEFVLKSNRKTGFLGIIICLNNLINLFKTINREDMSYLLSYKLSQDQLEVFFSAIEFFLILLTAVKVSQ